MTVETEIEKMSSSAADAAMWGSDSDGSDVDPSDVPDLEDMSEELAAARMFRSGNHH